MLRPSEFTQNSQPSQYQFRPPICDDGNKSDYFHDSGQFPQEDHASGHPACDMEPDIDKISPDEDDRMARQALRGISNCIKLSRTNTFTDPTPEHEPERYSLGFGDTRQIISDRDLGM